MPASLISKVEELALQKSNMDILYPPTEKINIIQVDNFPILGKLTALRFLEWVQQNPGGVISLPTGKTPEHFIKWVTHYLQGWYEPVVQKDLGENGVDPSVKPDMFSLHFVQIDEFFPINPTQHNSFYYYVNKFYINGLGLDPEKALLINCWTMGTPDGMTLRDVFPNEKVDLSLRTRFAQNPEEEMQQNVIQKIDQFCANYEQRIRELGGIGFFLGGIGPDGHIAFNIRGSDHFSTTRLTPTNYETQAAAATDLGGIEVAKNRLVITIGLATITFNKDAVAIIIAAGEAKAKIVSAAIENERDNQYPASSLQSLPNARFYITDGAAKHLHERQFKVFQETEELSDEQIEKVVIDLAVELEKRICDLTAEDFKTNNFSKTLLQKCSDNYKRIIKRVENSLIEKLDTGLKPVENKTIMHTAPHHDDIMLGYSPYIFHLVRTPLNTHHYIYMTSGFTAVTNQYMLNVLTNVKKHISSALFKQLHQSGYFNPQKAEFRDADISRYLDGVASYSDALKNEATSRRVLRNLVFLFEEDSLDHLNDRVNEMIDYFRTQYPGKKDLPYIQQLKGMIREWEADLLWAHWGFRSRSVDHLRLGFYKGDIFTEQPEVNRDVKPILELLKKVRPNVVTVAFDPEGSGPDTHYKVMQAISEALKIYEQETENADIQVWGYRNVWYRFHPSEINTIIPVSLNSMASMDSAFDNSFGSQKSASFPSYEYDGSFARLAQQIQSQQFLDLQTCLGQEFFTENGHPRLRASHGLCYLKKMSTKEFYEHTQALRTSMESATV